MDSEADDFDLFRELERQRKVNLITCCRQNMDKSPHRKKMIKFMEKKKHKKIYRERAFKVEPMQGIAKDIFDLDRCWMRGEENNRWLFAAMSLLSKCINSMPSKKVNQLGISKNRSWDKLPDS